jgi:hypothetical protein
MGFVFIPYKALFPSLPLPLPQKNKKIKKMAST